MTSYARQFYKLSGSGNDFIFFDARTEAAGALAEATTVQRLCARGTGVGADGIVFLLPHDAGLFAIRYLNADGSLASLCGNATLCSARLAVELGLALPGESFEFGTDDGLVRARMVGGEPEVELRAVEELAEVFTPAGAPYTTGPLGFARVGVPHLVAAVEAVEGVDVNGTGRMLRRDPGLRDGANVNFVSPLATGSGWRMRTYERGVEGETLACGTGAVATAAVLRAWGLTGAETRIQTSSGRFLTVILPGNEGDSAPRLRGEGRIVYRGELAVEG